MLILKVLKKLRDQWEKWDLRSFILLSLFLQIFINFFAPLRKRTTATWITALIWVAYLLSDWAANYAVGLISSTQNDDGNENSSNNSDLLAFWAPFLMVHLGGPDTITAYAVEDSKLWLRHLFSLIFQSLAAIYVFVQSLPENRLLIPNVLMFVAGFYKYTERTVSLYNARTDSDTGPDYAKLMEELHSKINANLPVYIEQIAVNDTRTTKAVKEGKLSETEVVLYAYKFFQSLNDFTADLIIGVSERNRLRNFFLKRTPEDAFKVIEVELNFIYEVLFTKVGVVYSKLGYCRRFISFALVVTSFLLFYFDDKKDFLPPDVAITYTLLIGAIVLDATAFIRIVTSNWFKATTKKLPDPTETTNNRSSEKKPACGFFAKILHVLKRRWSENVSTYSLIACFLNRRAEEMEKFISWLDILTDLLDSGRNVKSNTFTKDLRDHIFQELLMKSEMADDLDTAKEITAARGDWFLRFRDCSILLPYVADMDFDQSLLTWHIATEICYYGEEIGENKFRDFSKLLSDYMVYLLIKQPAMMAAVSGIGQIRFRDTIAEAKLFYFGDDGTKREPDNCHVIIYVLSWFFKRLLLSPYNLLCSIVDFFVCILVAPILKCTGKSSFKNKDCGEMRLKEEEMKFCKKILGVHTLVDPFVVKGDGSKSVLFDGCILAKKMIEMEKAKKVGDKWEIISKVWVEMLCYAAMHCRPYTHAIQLSKGGELVTLVWLLMVNFGFGNQFHDDEDHFRANIIGGK